MDIFIGAYIVFVVILGCSLIGIYKLAALFIKRSKSGATGIRVLRYIMVMAAIVTGVFIIKVGIWLYENPTIIDSDYDRGTYSVVFFNMTDKVIDGVEVFAGSNKVLVEIVDDIQPHEYRKVNIRTHQSDVVELVPSYDVYVQKLYDEKTELCVGYFGIDTGGIELVNIIDSGNGNIALAKESHSSNKYIKILRLDGKNQSILSWYD